MERRDFCSKVSQFQSKVRQAEGAILSILIHWYRCLEYKTYGANIDVVGYIPFLPFAFYSIKIFSQGRKYLLCECTVKILIHKKYFVIKQK